MSAGSAYEEIAHDYSVLRSALGDIRQEFEYGARAFPNLYYESVSAPKEPLSKQAWDGFIAANKKQDDDDEWEQWEVDPNGIFCMRYYGSQEWFEHFRRLAESGVLILREIEWLFGKLPNTPPNCWLKLPSYDGYQAWVHVRELSAQVSTPALRGVGRVWKLPDDHEGDFEQLMLESWDEPANGGDRFPGHPFCVSLHQNLFRSSAEAIQLWLHPDEPNAAIGDTYYDEEIIRLCSEDRIDWGGASARDTRQAELTAAQLHFEPPALDQPSLGSCQC